MLEDVDSLPTSFRVGYDPNDFSDRNTYGLSVSIYASDDKLLFTNDTAYDVITRGNPSRVEIDLIAIERSDITPEPDDGTSTLEGVINYDSNTPLPEGAVMTVQLREVSDQGTPGDLIAEQIIPNPAPFSVSFQLDYVTAGINESSSYVIQAEISLDGVLMFARDTLPETSLNKFRDAEIVLAPVQQPEPDTRPPVAREPERESSAAIITGTIRYDDQLELPAGSSMIISLQKINPEPFESYIPITEQTVINPGQSPVSFEVDPGEELDGNARYFVLIRVYGPEGQTILSNNFPDRAYGSGELSELSINLSTINPPENSEAAARLTGTVTGQSTYSSNSDLPAGAKLIAQIRDVSLADAPSDLIAEQLIVDPGKSPVKFEIKYDRNKIEDRRDYAVSIKIVGPDDKLLFITDTVYEVITRGNPNNVRIPLVQVRR